MTESVVRLATLADEPQVMSLCRALHGDNAIFPYSEPRVKEIVVPALRGEHGVVGVIDGGDHLEGGIMIQPDRMWYSDDGWFLNEIFNFVPPDYRKSNHAKALIAWALLQREIIGIPLMIGVISNERTAAKVKFYERQLGKPAGAFFLAGAVQSGSFAGQAAA